MPAASNIVERGRRRRWRSGWVSLTLASALAVVLVQAGVARGWRLTLLPLLYFGGLGIFQARAST